MPSVFPGQSAALSLPTNGANFAFERAQAIRAKRFFVKRNAFNVHGSSVENSSWLWTRIKRQKFKEISYTSEDLTNLDREILTLSKVVTDQTSLQNVFDLVRNAWGDGGNFEYLASAMEVALSVFLDHQIGSRLDVAFELEEFASYCTLRSTLELTHGSLRDGKWVDIGSQRISELRGSERCAASRLLNELERLSVGQTAPLLVNEFNCVADGNHRLAAAWIWNALNDAKEELWELGNTRFEDRLLSFFTQKGAPQSKLAISNALEGLSSILSNKTSKQGLINMRNIIATHVVERLPILPILSYSGLAIERKSYQSQGHLRRFSPRHYQILQTDSSTCLPAKACYHFADHLPLPLFSPITRNL